MMRSSSEVASVTIRPEQPQAQADRDACDRLLKAIFDCGLGQRQIARVTIPLSTVQRALQTVIGWRQRWCSVQGAVLREVFP
jgi:hypothetical protein